MYTYVCIYVKTNMATKYKIYVTFTWHVIDMAIVYRYASVQFKVIGINKENQIYIFNKEYTRDQRCA